MIAVPSRVTFTDKESRPLTGMRIAVKDVIDVEGYRTGASNRAYHALYPPKAVSSPIVDELISLGAVVIGKTKSTQFALGEEPTADWIDYHCPFNPRGDGYQTTEGSSAGSGAAVAAYDWLDLALGTDSKSSICLYSAMRKLIIKATGSVQLPAAFQGVFGFRPTSYRISQEGIVEVTS